MTEILLWMWIAFIAWGTGDKLLQWLIRRPDFSSRFFPALGAGYGLLAFEMLFLGLFQLYQQGIIWSLLVVQTLLVLCSFPFYSLRTIFFSVHKGRILKFLKSLSLLESVSLFLIAALVMKNFLGALSPESRHDVLDYHLNFPNLYVLHGGIYETPWHVFSYMPFNVEMLFTLGLSLSSDILPKLMSFGFSLVALGAMLQFGYRYFGRKTVLWAAALWLLNPWISFLTSTAYIETALAMWETLAVAGILLFFESLGILKAMKPSKARIHPEKSWKWCVVSGFFTGLALGAKYTVAIVFCLPLGLSILVVMFFFGQNDKRMIPKILGGLTLLAATAFLLVCPWFVRNAVWTGNPVYPILNEKLGLTEPVAQEAEAFMLGHLPEKSPWTQPVEVISQRLLELSLDGNLAVHLFLPIIPLTLLMVFLNGKSPAGYQSLVGRDLFLWVFSALVFLFWLFFTGNEDGRFMLPAFSVFSLLQADYYLRVFHWLANRLQRKGLQAGFALFLTVILTGCYTAVIHRFYKDLDESHWPVLSPSARRGFFEKRYPHHEILQYIEQQLPEDVKILGVGYPATRPYISHIKKGIHPIESQLGGKKEYTPRELAQAMNEAGLTHVVIPGGVRLPNFSKEELESAGFRPVFQGSKQALFQVPGTP